MAQDPNENRVSGVSTTTPKTPAQRAEQIRQLQDAAALTPAVTQTQTAGAPTAGTKTPSGAAHAVALFDVNPVAQVNKLSVPSTASTDSSAYGATQADPAALFGNKGADIEVTGVPWKIIPFGPGQVMDLKKPDSEYNVTLPPQAVVMSKGKLFEMTVAPKADGSEPVQKRALLLNNDNKLKGADWRTPTNLKKGIETIPDFATSLFSSMFKNPLKPGELQDFKVLDVKVGQTSAFEVTVQGKNYVNGSRPIITATVNNMGLVVPAAPKHDRLRQDLNFAQYYLDHYQAS